MSHLRSLNGWQIILADLSLILFTVTAAALSATPTMPQTASRSSTPNPAFSSRMIGTDLREWLTGYRADPRERLTIAIDYAPGTIEQALEQARQAHILAIDAGHNPQIVLREGDSDAMSATFAFDGSSALAHKLQ